MKDKNSQSNSQLELAQRKQVYESAKRMRKHAKATYKAEEKAFKTHLKSFKQMYEHAVLAEKEAKKAYKALRKEVAKYENEISMVEELIEEGLSILSDAVKEEMFSPENKRPRTRKPKAMPEIAGGEPKKKVPRSTKAAKTASKTATEGDDLTKVKGVGDVVADMLRANGIRTYADMAATSYERYKELLKANGMSQFRNPTTWAEQAAALAAAPMATAQEEPKTRKSGAGRKPKAEKPAEKPARTKAPKVKAEKPAKAAKSEATGGDDLTKVKGVGDVVADMLRANGIRTYSDMAATSYERYKELLKANGMSQFRNPTTWAEQAAALAAAPMATAQEEPKTRKSGAGRKPKAEKPAEKPARTKAPKVKAEKPAKAAKSEATGGDDLTKVKGVGDVVADMLRANGIRTYSDMAATSYERYKELLKANGMSQFRNPTTWAEQAAALAAAPAPVAEITATAQEEPKARKSGAGRKPKAEKAEAPVEEKKPKGRAKAKAPAALATASAAPKGNDDLTKINGIGGRVAEVLNGYGIRTYADVAATSAERFKEILQEHKMSRFRDPSNWPVEAAELMNAG